MQWDKVETVAAKTLRDVFGSLRVNRAKQTFESWVKKDVLNNICAKSHSDWGIIGLNDKWTNGQLCWAWSNC